MTRYASTSSLAFALRVAVAIVMIAIVLYFLISPLVELPETDLRGILAAVLLLGMLAMFLAQPGRSSRALPSPSANLDLSGFVPSTQTSSMAPLRC